MDRKSDYMKYGYVLYLFLLHILSSFKSFMQLLKATAIKLNL